MKRSIPFFAALFALSLVLSASAAAQASKCGDRDYTCKIAAYTAQIADNKDDIEAYYNRGNAKYDLGDKRGSSQWFDGGTVWYSATTGVQGLTGAISARYRAVGPIQLAGGI